MIHDYIIYLTVENINFPHGEFHVNYFLIVGIGKIQHKLKYYTTIPRGSTGVPVFV